MKCRETAGVRNLARIVSLTLVLAAGFASSASAQIPSNSRWSGPGVHLDDHNYGYAQCWDEAWADGSLQVAVGVAPLGDPDRNQYWSGLSGYNYGYSSAYKELRPLTYTGAYACYGDVYLDGSFWYEDYWIAGSVYVEMIDITIQTFIPENNYRVFSVTAEGDNRLFNRYGPSRSSHVLAVYSPLADVYLIESSYPAGGLTQVYDYDSSVDGNSNLTDEARNDTTLGDHYLKHFVGQSDGQTMDCTYSKSSINFMGLHCSGNEATPYCTENAWDIICAGITYDFYLDFWFNDDGTINFLVQGGHDAFPSYEVYVGDQRVYEWDHGNWDIWWLSPPEDISGFYDGGDIY